MYSLIVKFVKKAHILIKGESSSIHSEKVQKELRVPNEIPLQSTDNQDYQVNYNNSYQSDVEDNLLNKCNELENMDDEVSLFEKNLMNYQIYKISEEEILHLYKCDAELTDSIIEEFSEIAQEFINLLIKTLDIMKMSPRRKKIIEQRYELNNEKGRSTLQAIGEKFGLSRERVRQIVIRETSRWANEIKKGNNIAFRKLRSLMYLLFKPGTENYQKRFILFYVNGFVKHDRNVLKLLVNLLFDLTKDEIEAFEVEFNQYIQDLHDLYMHKKASALNKKFFDKKIGNKVQWPVKCRILFENDYKNVSQVRKIDRDDGYNGYSVWGEYYSNKMKRIIQYESLLEKRLLTILESNDLVVFYEVQPFKIGYEYMGEKVYVPDVFFVLNDGRGIVAEVKPRFHMVIDLNYQKYKVLKKYCETEGYGVLYIDRSTSLEEYISYEYNKAFERELLNKLSQGPIKWNEFSNLKYRYNIGFRDLACVVVNNDLLYDMEPFILSRRDSNLI